MRKYSFDPYGLDLSFPQKDDSYDRVIGLHRYVENHMAESGVELWGSIRPPSSLEEEAVIVECIVRDAIVSELFKWLASDNLSGDVAKLTERVDVICALYRSEIRALKTKLFSDYITTIQTMWNKEAACHQIATVVESESPSL